VKVIPIALQSHLDSGALTTAFGLKITRADATVFRFTSHDADVLISGDGTYLSDPGLDVASLAFNAGLAVDNTELTILADDTIITRDDIQAGRWDGATFSLIQFNWASPSDGVLVHMTGSLGNVQPRGKAYVAELRDIRQVLQQDYTAVLQEECRYRFCDFPAAGGISHCTLDAADFTEPVTVTSVAAQNEFTDTARIEAAGTFTEGLVTWLTGLNAGLRVKVRAFAGGVFELAQPMVYAIQIGDTADALKGCAKTRAACKSYSNILNYGGEPDKPALDTLMAPANYDA
jgi:uncharacterized phage protein (TIGR02218 family)